MIYCRYVQLVQQTNLARNQVPLQLMPPVQGNYAPILIVNNKFPPLFVFPLQCNPLKKAGDFHILETVHIIFGNLCVCY